MKTFHSFIGTAVLLAFHGVASAAGDAVRGQELYESRCIGCHSVDDNKSGPLHKGVFGRKAGQVPGYDYSQAVKASKLVWREKTLDLWLTNPELAIPGQKMGYFVMEARDRADLIAYLKKVSPP
jgi:cytochrome c